MPIIKRLPWVSLGLLLLTYVSLGWVISKAVSKAHVPPYTWLIVVNAVLFLVGFLTTPWSWMSDYANLFLQSKLRSFGLAILGAFLFFLMIAWFRVFLDTLVIIAAIILVRIDFQSAGIRQAYAFWITCFISLCGLFLGALIQRLMAQYIIYG
jgi:signal transduction histidine kinase